MKRNNLVLVAFLAILVFATDTKAQFNTITDRRNINYEILPSKTIKAEDVELEHDTIKSAEITVSDSIAYIITPAQLKTRSKDIVRKKHLDFNRSYEGLPDLTINNLVREIRKNGIKYEKVVLAQAILETGWFTSSVCRNKNNLFGLTNPRTGEYYEFNHWSESVKAYYTKVQYRYKGGNYLLWLDKIGYAEDKTYVLLLIKLMKQYFV